MTGPPPNDNHAGRLVGREREQTTLREGLAAALAGRGSLILLGGEAGLGKTVLARALGREATAAGAAVALGHCYDLSATPPYGPWLDTGLFAPASPGGRITPERRRILDFVRQHRSVRPADLADGLGLTPANAAQALHRLLARGMVIQTAYGAYALPPGDTAARGQTGQTGPAPTTAKAPPLFAPSAGDGAESGSHAAPFEQIRDYLAAIAARRPLVLILEDLHWSDPASLELLRYLARHLDALPLLLLATYRDDELTRQHPLYQLLPILAREAAARRLDLRPLETAALGTLAAAYYALPPPDTSRLVDYLARRSGGNPFFALELLRALEEERTLRRDDERWALATLDDQRLPVPLRQVIDGRLLRLGEADRHLLAIAATIGQEVPIGLWQAVSEATEDRLAEVVEAATAAHILEESPGNAGLRFRHALLREAIYFDLALPRRRLWHRRIGEALAVIPDATPDDVAYHFRQAGDTRASTWLIRAGERAERAYAVVTAAEHFAAAAELVGGDGAAGRSRGWLLLRTGVLLCYSHTVRSVAILERAEQAALALGDRELAINSLFSRGIVQCMQGSMRRGIAAMAEAIAAADELARTDPTWPGKLTARFVPERAGAPDSPPPPGTARSPHQHVNVAENYLVEWLAHAGHFREAVRLGERYLARIAAATPGRGQSPATCGNTYFGLGVAHAALGAPERARAAFARARQEFAVSHQRVLVSFALINELLLVTLPYHPEQHVARRALAADEQAAQAHGAGAFAGDHPLGIGAQWLHLVEGRWDAASELDTPERSAFESGALRQYAVCTLGELARLRGDSDDAWRWVREVLPLGAATEPGEHRFFSAVYTQRLAAALALDSDDLPLARSWLECHDRWLAWSGATLWCADGRLLWARYHRLDADLAGARRCAWEARELAESPPQPLALLAIARDQGELALIANDLPGARAHLAEAMALADACDAPHERALVLLALAELHLAARDLAAARTALAEARSIGVGLGAGPLLARIGAIEGQLPAGPQPRDPGRLSARELDVLRLVAEGLTDGQIAARLSISPRTVGQHLGSIYTRLAVPSRAAAVRQAVARGLI